MWNCSFKKRKISRERVYTPLVSAKREPDVVKPRGVGHFVDVFLIAFAGLSELGEVHGGDVIVTLLIEPETQLAYRFAARFEDPARVSL